MILFCKTLGGLPVLYLTKQSLVPQLKEKGRTIVGLVGGLQKLSTNMWCCSNMHVVHVRTRFAVWYCPPNLLVTLLTSLLHFHFPLSLFWWYLWCWWCHFSQLPISLICFAATGKESLLLYLELEQKRVHCSESKLFWSCDFTTENNVCNLYIGSSIAVPTMKKISTP